MALPEPLRFTIGLIDQISEPLANIQRGFANLTSNYRSGVEDMITGAAGLAGAGLALYASLQPAIEMDNALANLKALDATDADLKAVTNAAFEFSNQFGKSAVEVVQTAENIRQVMGDMPSHVLASVTKSSSVLAMAMKSDTETTTRFIKNLYGNYKDDAESMGVDAWTAQVAGMAAQVKKSFGITMDGLEGGIDGMHSLTSSLSVSLSEQMAVLGMLQQQMSEGDATTQYTNFLEGAVGAQEKLGVSFTDSSGNLLPMLDILEQVKPLIEGLSGADARFKLDEAGLGDGSLMLINMIDRIDEFKAGLNSIEDVTGLYPAIKMATDMTSQFERLGEGVKNIRTAIGMALMPSLVPLVSSLADGASEIIKWTQLFPNITRWVGYITFGIIGFTAVNGALVLIMGIAKQAMASWTIVTTLAGGAVTAFTATLKFLRGAMFAANIVIAANPIILIVGAVVLAIGAIGALIYWWDDLKASFGDTGWFQALTLLIAPLRALFEFIKGGWTLVTSGFSDFTAFDGLFAIVNEIKAVFGNMFGWISESFGDIFNKIKIVGSWLGFGDDETASTKVDAVQQSQPSLKVQQGQVAQNFASYHQGRTTNYGGVSIYAQQMNSPYDLANELELAAP